MGGGGGGGGGGQGIGRRSEFFYYESKFKITTFWGAGGGGEGGAGGARVLRIQILNKQKIWVGGARGRWTDRRTGPKQFASSSSSKSGA